MKIAIPVSTSDKQYYINCAYTKYVALAGFAPIMVGLENDPMDIAELCDGLLLPGGGDLDPIFYNEDNICSYSVDPIKDDFERSLYHAFLEKEKKVFGICRGMQLIFLEYMRLHPEHSMYLDYYQHQSDHSLANELKTARWVRTHSVRCKDIDLYGEGNKKVDNLYVNSMHHQVATALPGPKNITSYNHGLLKVIAHTRHGMGPKKKDPGFIIEALDIKLGGGVRGVQWHPEEMRDVKLIQHFFSDKKKTDKTPNTKALEAEIADAEATGEE